jgi:hypothetical protein
MWDPPFAAGLEGAFCMINNGRGWSKHEHANV